ncbi:MAG: hypothetical protein F4Y07_00110 [Gemmatimonadetes bacterium]|nr:hypothetical protein [Gemmatimonadota bacterium]MYE14862.1 hypothetical protein [Gemmatimonadota bacterium]
MLGFIDWYLNSLAQFWGTAIRIGLPQILLVILLICWIRRKRCGKPAAGSSGKSCCWMWTCGCDGDCWFCRPPESGCTCRWRCCEGAGPQDADEEEEEDGDS